MKTAMNAKEAVRQEAKENILEHLKKGDTVYTILRSRSRSGMSRRIDLMVLDPKRGPIFLTYWAYKLFEGKTPTPKQADNGSGLRVDGCGMDMGFSIVYDLARTLFGDGYALQQRWI